MTAVALRVGACFVSGEQGVAAEDHGELGPVEFRVGEGEEVGGDGGGGRDEGGLGGGGGGIYVTEECIVDLSD